MCLGRKSIPLLLVIIEDIYYLMRFQKNKLYCGLNKSKNNSVFEVLTLNVIRSSLFCRSIKTNHEPESLRTRRATRK